MKNATFKFSLGDRVKDRVTGFSGIVVGRTEWINGCKRIAVQSEKLKDNKPADNEHIDEGQCDLVKPSAVKVDAAQDKPPGGPMPTPQRQANPR